MQLHIKWLLLLQCLIMDKGKYINNDAETEVLGAVLLDNKVFKDIIEVLIHDDFYNKSNSIIGSVARFV